MEAYLIYYINKGLSIVSTKISDLLGLITVREDVRDQMDALIRGKGAAGQPFPGWRVLGICDQPKNVMTD